MPPTVGKLSKIVSQPVILRLLCSRLIAIIAAFSAPLLLKSTPISAVFQQTGSCYCKQHNFEDHLGEVLLIKRKFDLLSENTCTNDIEMVEAYLHHGTVLKSILEDYLEGPDTKRHRLYCLAEITEDSILVLCVGQPCIVLLQAHRAAVNSI
jgi:hypothetical protein